MAISLDFHPFPQQTSESLSGIHNSDENNPVEITKKTSKKTSEYELVFKDPLHAYLCFLTGDFLREILDELKPRDADCKVKTVDKIKLKLKLLNKKTLPVDNTGLFYELLTKYLESSFPDLHLTPQEIVSESITTNSQSVRVAYRTDEKLNTPIISLIKYGSDSEDSNPLLSIQFDKHGFASIVEGEKDKENDPHINEIIKYAKFFSRGWIEAQMCLKCFRILFGKNGKSDYSIKRSEDHSNIFQVKASPLRCFKNFGVKDRSPSSNLLSLFLTVSRHQDSKQIPCSYSTLTNPGWSISQARSLKEKRCSYLKIQRQSCEQVLRSILKKYKEVTTKKPFIMDALWILERFNELENPNRATTQKPDDLRPFFLHLFEGRHIETTDSPSDDFIIPMDTWVNALNSIKDLNCTIYEIQNCLLALQAKKDAQFEEIPSEISDLLKLFVDHFLEETDLSKVKIILHMLPSKKKTLKIFGCELCDLLFEPQHPLRIKGGLLSENSSLRGTFIPDEKYALRCMLQLCCYEENPDISNSAWLSVTDLPFNDTLVGMLHNIYHSDETSKQLKEFLYKNILSSSHN